MLLLLTLGVMLAALGCRSLLERAVVPRHYREVALPAERVLENLPYRQGPDAHPLKHRLDLFLPDAGAAPWPVLVFVHGGGWITGDKGLRAGGRDVYANIGRCFASRGVGVALVNYRLLPEVGWRAQLADVAEAVAFVRREVPRHGGDPDALLLSGHSAGAWLVAHAVLEPAVLARAGVPASSVCGWVPVSGSGYDLVDPESYELGARRWYYRERFAARAAARGDDWMLEASPALLARLDAPPALVVHGTREFAPLRRQSRLLYQALHDAGAPAQLLQVPGAGHLTIVLAFSRPEGPLVPELLAFAKGCRAARPATTPARAPAAPRGLPPSTPATGAGASPDRRPAPPG